MKIKIEIEGNNAKLDGLIELLSYIHLTNNVKINGIDIMQFISEFNQSNQHDIGKFIELKNAAKQISSFGATPKQATKIISTLQNKNYKKNGA